MNILLIGINAKFIHSNLAIRSIREYCLQKTQIDAELMEFTINQHLSYILPEIYKKNPSVIGFSCYIWNFDFVSRLIIALRKLLPDCFLFVGGPEVTYNPDEVLANLPINAVVVGEGEAICTELFSAIREEKPLHTVSGFVYRENENIIHTSPALPPNMADLPFVYHTLDDLQNRILYYESIRGCPFQCQYCLSCNDTGVRFLPLERVFRDLDFFLNRRVRQVKFVDRTFNCNKQHALAIWRYLAEHDNGITNFHFEIAAELLDDEILTFLNSVRRGLFQFEIGVQSTNPKTLEHIKRITKIDELRHIVARLQENKNIHLHLDLIIGLPYEGYERFKTSFCDVYSLSPDQLQVGFLKLLKGSGLYYSRERYGIVCNDYAPYEVLYTNDLSYRELLRLKMIEEMVELYYNSNRFQCLLRYLNEFFTTPFDLFESLADFYESQGYHRCSHTNVEYYSILYRFFKTLPNGDDTQFQWYAKFDLYSHEKAKKLPDWLTVSLMQNQKTNIYEFYAQPQIRVDYLPDYADCDEKQLCRFTHLEQFPFCPMTGANTKTTVLFDYRNCDLLGNATHHVVSFPAPHTD